MTHLPGHHTVKAPTDFSDYHRQRLIVTGVATGIGETTAQALVELGADVIESTAEAAHRTGLYQAVDLTDPATIESVVAAIGGQVYALFNCAGAVSTIPAADALKVNFLGTRLLTEHVLLLMSAGGAVANVSSDAGFGWREKLPQLLDFLSDACFQDGAKW